MVLHAIIPAGGAGTRLWPLSRKGKPKFLLDPLGRGRTLLQDTFDRLRKVSLTITVVTGADHYDEVCRQLPELTGESDDPFPGEILIEPNPRDSMAAIGLATYIIRERYGDLAVVGSFAADHVIEDIAVFEDAVKTAVQGASADLLTTMGIVPSEPSTAFGYIAPGQPPLAQDLFPVARFVEKPDRETAREYVEEGYLWNAGIFVARTGMLADALAEFLPAMHTQLETIAAAHMASLIEDGEAAPIQVGQWDHLQKIAIDYALAEPLAALGRVAVVRTSPNLGWSDVGDFLAVHRLRGDQPNLVLGAADKPYRVLGLENIGVIDTGDALLVLDLNRAQDVKEIVDDLAAQGRQDLL